LALKAGKPVVEVSARHTSQECPKYGHIDQKNRLGEKFLCIVCHHVDHADTKASRTIGKRVGLVFLKNKKTLRADCAKVTPSVEMTPPVGSHEEIAVFLAAEVTVEFKSLKLPYFIPKTAFVKPELNDSGYSPDILLLNRPNLVNEPLWKKESTVNQAASITLVIEVVSSN